MSHVVQFSGGAGSFAAAVRVAETFGRKNVTLLCADTRSEHDDWRPFVDATAEHLGVNLVVLDQGVDLWELAFDQKMIPNTRADFCSRILKREPLRAWLDENRRPSATTVYFGFDWTESHRLERCRPLWEPWHIAAPLTWQPMIDKTQALRMIGDAGLPMPAAYNTGMPHNNCLRYGCVKGGVRYWKQVLREHPEAFAASEANEERFRRESGKDVAILRDRTKGTTNPLPLRDLRLRVEAEPTLFDGTDFWGSCSCMEETP